MGPQHGPLPSLKGSELWAPVLKVVYDDLILDPQYKDSASTLDLGRMDISSLRTVSATWQGSKIRGPV